VPHTKKRVRMNSLISHGLNELTPLVFEGVKGMNGVSLIALSLPQANLRCPINVC
jgi:hypothetical protein